MPIDPSIPYGVQGVQIANPMQTLGGMLQLREQRQEADARDLAIQKANQARVDEDAYRSIIRSHSKPDGQVDYDGALYDLDRTVPTMAMGLRSTLFEQVKKKADAEKTTLENAGTKLKIASQIAEGITDDTSFMAGRAKLAEIVGPEMAAQLGDRYDPQRMQRVVTWGLDAKDVATRRQNAFENAIKAADLAQKASTNAHEWESKKPAIASAWTAAASQYLSTARTSEDWQQGLEQIRQGMSGLPPELRDGVIGKFAPQFSPDAAKAAAQVGIDPKDRAALTETNRHNLATEAVDRQREARQARETADAEGAVPNLTPEALDMVAQRYAMTGELPPMGMGKAAAKVRTDVINKAAAMYDGLDLASQKAAYDANRGSLTKMQAQRDAITSFEETAKKNIDVYLKTAAKVVDTGSPMANSIARKVSGKMLGSEDQALFDAARAVVIPEIAKIITNPNLSGVLSDSARHEVSEFNPDTATLGQTVKVMRLLQGDMKNRSESLDATITDIKGRLSKKPAGRAASAPTQGAAGNVSMTAPDGRPLSVPPDQVNYMLSIGAKRAGG